MKHIDVAIGCAGLVLMLGCMWIMRTIGRGPGDDNPVAFIALLGLCLTVIPASGLRYLTRDDETSWLWRVLATATVGVVGVFEWVLLVG